MTHAAYSIMGDLVITHGKTTKTACGKRVVTTKLTDRNSVDCEACRREIAFDRATAIETTRLAKEWGVMPASQADEAIRRMLDSYVNV